ncbi:8849_t:CDS:2, partial [Racocetra fulgida]
MEKLTAYNKKGSCSKEETLTTNSIPKTPVDPAQQDGNDNSTPSWEEQVSLENEIGFSKESENQNNKLDASDHETRNEKLNNKEDSVPTTTKRKKNRTTSFEGEEERNKTLEQEVLTEDLNMDMNQTEETPLPNSEETLTNSEK